MKKKDLSTNLYGEQLVTNLKETDSFKKSKMDIAVQRKKNDKKIKNTQKDISDLERQNQNHNLTAAHTQGLLILVLLSQAINAQIVAYKESAREKLENKGEKMSEHEQKVMDDLKEQAESYNKLIENQKGGTKFAKDYGIFQETYAKLRTLEFASANIGTSLVGEEMETFLQNSAKEQQNLKYKLETLAKTIKIPNGDEEFQSFDSLEELEGFLDKSPIEKKETGGANYRAPITKMTTSAKEVAETIIKDYGAQMATEEADTGAFEILTKKLTPIVSNLVNGYSEPTQAQADKTIENINAIAEEFEIAQKMLEAKEEVEPTQNFKFRG